MNYGADHDSLLLNNYFIDHPIWKVLRISPANVLAWMAAAMQQRVFAQGIEHRDNFFRESDAKPFTAALVPGAASSTSPSASGRTTTRHVIVLSASVCEPSTPRAVSTNQDQRDASRISPRPAPHLQ